MKKLFIAIITVLILLTGCSKNTDEPDNTSHDDKFTDDADIFSNADAVEALNVRWFFVPEKAEIIRTAESREKLQVDFKGCEYAEINQYAKQVFNTLSYKGCTVYNAKTLDYTKLTKFEEEKLDLSFTGTAYAYYYVLGGAVYFIEIEYYGCGSGAYGNGKTSVVITDVTETLNFLLEE